MFGLSAEVWRSSMATQSGAKKSNFAAGKWKSTSQNRPVPKPAAAPAAKPAEAAPVKAAPANPPKSLAERLPTLTDAQLLALQANAARVSQVESDRKHEEAAELLPLIAAELGVRKSAKAEAALEKKKGAAAKRASTRSAKLIEKSARETEDAEEEGAAN
jgi:hypothetical protein